MDNTIQLYSDREKKNKVYPITSPDRVIDENGVNIKDKIEEINSSLDNIESIVSYMVIMSRYVSVPTAWNSPGIQGDWSADDNYLYVCQSNNSWRRVALTSW